MENHTVYPEHAKRFAEWIETRGGLALWNSIDLSDLDKSWTTPYLSQDGTPVQKPHWKSDSKPHRVITSMDEVDVITSLEVRRFRVGVRSSSNGLALKVTDGGTRRIRAAVAKARENREDKMAWYEFDYETQEAVICVPGSRVPLSRWIEGKVAKVS